MSNKNPPHPHLSGGTYWGISISKKGDTPKVAEKKDITFRTAKPKDKAYKISVEKGLFMFVTLQGNKYWRMKYRFDGKEKLLALGVYDDVTLAKARVKRDEARKLLADGIDPGEHKKIMKQVAEERSANSFEVIAREWFAKYSTNWVKSHADKIIQRFGKRRELLLSVQKTVTKLFDSLESDDALQEPTVYFQIALEKELSVLPNIEAKRPQNTYAWRLVDFIIRMYKTNSKSKLSCYYSSYNSSYNGKFYYFLVDILPLLECVGITIDTKISTLAGYAAKLIPQHRLKKPYFNDIGQIDETLLQA